MSAEENYQEPNKLMTSPAELRQLLEILQDEILPLTEKAVDDGNKIFGAAVLSRQDWGFQTRVAAPNAEVTTSPLHHAPVNAIEKWCQQVEASQRGTQAKESVLLSTHEPCCMCISSIVWTGFQQVYHLFPGSYTAKQGAIPHDANIQQELFGVTSYRKQNKYCSTACIMELVEELPPEEPLKEELQLQVASLMDAYEVLSRQYQEEKQENAENSLAFS